MTGKRRSNWQSNSATMHVRPKFVLLAHNPVLRADLEITGEQCSAEVVISKALAIKQDQNACLLISLATLAPVMLHRSDKFLGGKRIQHVLFGEPGAPGLQYAKANLVQVRRVMGIGINHDLHAMLFR